MEEESPSTSRPKEDSETPGAVMPSRLQFESSDPHPEFVELDPTGRYGRCLMVLKFRSYSFCSYKAFDEYQGIEVAWNQVKLLDSVQSPGELERLYCEIHLLKTLKHENIMKFYCSWVDVPSRNINFVTEMFTSGTLRQYRLKHRKVNIRAVKHWCRQILKGLLYLHSHDPPIIHRDLKCDNIFINGNQGEVKIGDLGLAAILRKSYAAPCVGTPEFMAPEVYEEEYNELVDIYSFGMCVLEMVTFEYPYSECTHAAQIYKRVAAGKKPDALYKLEDLELRQFVEKCLATVSSRLSARELLMDPFLQIDDYGSFNGGSPLVGRPLSFDHTGHYLGYDLEYPPPVDCDSEIDLYVCEEDKHFTDVEIAIHGRNGDDDGIFLRLRVSDVEGRIRNIYFPFDVENDTAMSVVSEMVSELAISDKDAIKIADMIDDEIASLVPQWKKDSVIDMATAVDGCSNDKEQVDRLSTDGLDAKNVAPYHRRGASTNGQFEEVTYQVEGSETDGQQKATSHGDDEEEALCNARNSVSSTNPSMSNAYWEDYENEIKQELRWLKAKFEMQLREVRDKQLGLHPGTPLQSSTSEGNEDGGGVVSSSLILPRLTRENGNQSIPIHKENGGVPSANFRAGRSRRELCRSGSFKRLERTSTTLYRAKLLPKSLHRAASLPVDAVEV
ncbi:unnamed protein product [Linum tenue]|uniref:non-specific serine/threonine protein kinase n=1 Tax=Linum tenue TaxID=586396 RepID=A0AAV0RTE9_9ROSI|nr:unnamed protein product [Linum tenue]